MVSTWLLFQVWRHASRSWKQQVDVLRSRPLTQDSWVQPETWRYVVKCLANFGNRAEQGRENDKPSPGGLSLWKVFMITLSSALLVLFCPGFLPLTFFSVSKVAAAKQIPAGEGTVPSVLTTSFFLMMTYQQEPQSKTFFQVWFLKNYSSKVSCRGCVTIPEKQKDQNKTGSSDTWPDRVTLRGVFFWPSGGLRKK